MLRFSLVVLFCTYFACVSVATPTDRIVGGYYATAGQLQHQVSLRLRGAHNCGGSIISKLFILTAAHCVGGFYSKDNFVTYEPSALTVRAGSTDRFQGGVLMDVAKVIAHENYGDILNDVALLRLEEEMIFSDKIKPIPLASAEVPAGAKVLISGWGRVKQGGDSPQKLKWNELIVITGKECNNRINVDSDSIICLDHASNNGACHGDSGGPAVYNSEIVGIAGFVSGGCGLSNPDGYAKVSYHRDWIIKHSDLK